jgi:DNA-binding transcriptional ArsR family regulator
MMYYGWCDMDFCKGLTKEQVNERLISQQRAGDLEDLFKTLANETRLRILHALSISGEMCVNDLAGILEMKTQSVSNQLQKLAALRVVSTRRSGVSIFYRITDPCVEMMLERGICMLESTSNSRISS